jgi:hypothetical protein
MISHNKYTISLVEPHIVRIHIHEDAEIELNDAKLMRENALSLVNGEKFTILFDANHRGTITPEARAQFACKEYTDVRVGAAILTNSLANKIIGNFFIKFNKPASPTRIFSNEPSAIEWLRDRVKQSI